MTAWTEGQEVTIISREIGGYDEFVHCKLAKITKTSVTTDTGQRFTIYGRLWGSGNDRWNHRYLVDRATGLEREADGAEERAQRKLRDAVLKHYDALRAARHPLDQQRALETAKQLVALLESAP